MQPIRARQELRLQTDPDPLVVSRQDIRASAGIMQRNMTSVYKAGQVGDSFQVFGNNGVADTSSLVDIQGVRMLIQQDRSVFCMVSNRLVRTGFRLRFPPRRLLECGPSAKIG
jgi:hypothetical protein